MLLDFFCYTTATPSCTLDLSTLIEAARDNQLDGLCIIDQQHSRHAVQLGQMAKRAQFFVAVGVELPTTMGTLVAFAPSLEEMATESWRRLYVMGTPTPEAVVAHFEAGAVVARAPFSEGSRAVRDAIFGIKGLHGLDCLHPNRRRIDNELALEAATAMGISGLAGSAAMDSTELIGSVATAVGKAVHSQAELVECLRAHDAWPVALRPLGDAAPSEAEPAPRPPREEAAPSGSLRRSGGRDRGEGERDERHHRRFGQDRDGRGPRRDTDRRGPRRTGGRPDRPRH